jgi:glycosyltransferase involved in cell wall biosynthesis
MVRVAICWDSFPDYVSRCTEALAKQGETQVLAYSFRDGAFPNVMERLRHYPNIRLLEENSPDRVLDECQAFAPHVAVLTLTRRALSRRSIFAEIASAWRKSGTIVIGACDHLWKGDWRDYGNLLFSKLGWFSPYEAVLVPGALGKIYARKIGFSEQNIFDGMYTCNTDAFKPLGLKRHQEKADTDWPEVFLFVGQFIHRKGLDILLSAYQAYRRQAPHPWELWLIGSGEMEKDIGAAPGVRNLGVKSSSQIAEIMLQSGCLILPSRVDHWGVVIHEAACTGLPILASNMCGASVELVQSGFNGHVFPANDAAALAKFLLFMDEGGMAREMGKNSLQVASRFSPELWAKRILVDIPCLLKGRPLG